MTGSSAILLVDHGSRREASNRRLEQLAAELRVRSGRLVEPAHMEIAEPTITQGLERLVEQGATRVVVVPYFLSPGRHSMEDVPRLAAEAAAAHPGLALRVAPPLGPDERLTRLVPASRRGPAARGPGQTAWLAPTAAAT